MRAKLFILAILWPFFSMCQPLSLKGKIINEQGDPLEGVTITILRTGIIRTSNSIGEFNLTGLQVNDTLKFSAIGYQTSYEVFDQTIRDRITVIMKRKTSELDDVVIMAYGSTT